jgi:hypothetical protein
LTFAGQKEEWLARDLVIDTRETWRSWVWRQLNFEEPPLVPREDLPEEYQPHRSFYGKMACFVNGIDPNPPNVNLRNSAPPLSNPMMENYGLGKVVPLRLANTVVKPDASADDITSQ